MKSSLAVLAALLFGIGGDAIAQQAPGGGGATQDGQIQQGRQFQFESSFWDIDANQDGAIDPDEVQGHWDVVEHWVELDADGSGKIEREEFAAFERGGPGKRQESLPLPEEKSIEGQTQIPPQD